MVTAYMSASTVSTPLWGKLGDQYGRKGLFQGAIVIFPAGPLLPNVSPDIRACCGVKRRLLDGDWERLRSR